jgi:phosphoribosylformylglycinamidine synthase subunit PurL
VLPTPVIGMLGVLADAAKAVPSAFQSPGDLILLLGTERGEIGGSEYLFQRTGQILGDAPDMDLSAEKSLQALCIELSARSWISSAHDCAEGGLAVALAEAVIESIRPLGATVTDYPLADLRADFSLFGETQSRVIVSCNPSRLKDVRRLAADLGVAAVQIGKVERDPALRICSHIKFDVAELQRAYRSAIPAAVGEMV